MAVSNRETPFPVDTVARIAGIVKLSRALTRSFRSFEFSTERNRLLANRRARTAPGRGFKERHLLPIAVRTMVSSEGNGVSQKCRPADDSCHVDRGGSRLLSSANILQGR